MYYFVANIKIKNYQEYQKYVALVDEVFSKFNGKYIAIDDEPQVLEGAWKYTRAVIIEFGSKSDFEQWYNSESYQKILKHRLAAADCDTILISGK